MDLDLNLFLNGTGKKNSERNLIDELQGSVRYTVKNK